MPIQSATAETLDLALAHLSDPPPREFFCDGTLRPEDLLYTGRGAVYAQRLGGGQAAIAVPQTEDAATAALLAQAITWHLDAEGLRVLHVVTSVPPPAMMPALEQAGFCHTTDLLLMQRAVRPDDATVPTAFSFLPAAANDLSFAELIEATYQNSLDLPELNGSRSLEETLQAAQISARCDPPLWWTAHAQGCAVGVLQLSPGEQPGEVELVYMGLIPQARGQGLGTALARAALAVAVALEAERVVCSRDARNSAAGAVYDQLGFETIARRGVWLKFCRASGRP